MRMSTRFTATLIICSFAAACGGGGQKSHPEDVVWAMFKSAGKGDIDEYLGCFSQSLKEKIGSAIAEMGEERFKQYLAQTDKDIIGIAITDRQQVAEDEIHLKVELVFKNSNDVQKFALRKTRNTWKIEEISGSAKVKMLIPYGTQVYPSYSDDR